jgi:hypothetical protein
MKTYSKVLGLLLFTAFIVGCTKVDFNSPIDSRGNNFQGEQYAADDDNDGVANYYDEHSIYHPKDTIPPEISFTKNTDTVWIPINDPNNLLNTYKNTVKAIDINDGDITSKLTETRNVQLFKEGTGTITYSVSDSSGNSAQKIRYVVVYTPTVADKTPPKITLLNGDTLRLFTTDAFDDQKQAIAIDDIDGDVTTSIQKTGSVDMTKPGTYQITYNVSDKAGNKATAVLTVIVSKESGQDLEPPTITLKGKNPDSIKVNVSYVDSGYTAKDNVDGDVTSKVVVTRNIDSSKAGIYQITYKVKDNAGWETSKTRIIVVGDGGSGGGDVTAPIILLNGKLLDTVLLNSSYVDPGVKSAIDDVDGDLKSKVVPTGTVDTKTVGTYTITYTVKDNAGNTGTTTRKVTVIQQVIVKDTIKPVITLKGKNPDTVMLNSAAYTDPGATALDNKDGDISSKIQPTGTVDVTKAGTYTITYTVSDAALNSATATRKVVVKDTGSIGGDLLTKYGVPSASALQSINNIQFKTVKTEGTGAPSLTNVSYFTLNWDLSQSGLYTFAIQTTDGKPGYYVDLRSSMTQTFKDPKPKFTLTASGFTGLDGEYYVTGNATQFVWVKTDGSYAIIWTP